MRKGAGASLLKKTRRTRALPAAGFYAAIALVAYAVYGALSNDLYLPGRRSGGIHLHHEALPPALLGIALYALTLPLAHFRQTPWLVRGQRLLQVGALLAAGWALYAIAKPSGKALATTAECQATFVRIQALAFELDPSPAIQQFFEQRRAECAAMRMLKSYHDCVARATVASDINRCDGESKRLAERRNAS